MELARDSSIGRLVQWDESHWSSVGDVCHEPGRVHHEEEEKEEDDAEGFERANVATRGLNKGINKPDENFNNDDLDL